MQIKIDHLFYFKVLAGSDTVYGRLECRCRGGRVILRGDGIDLHIRIADADRWTAGRAGEDPNSTCPGRNVDSGLELIVQVDADEAFPHP